MKYVKMLGLLAMAATALMAFAATASADDVTFPTGTVYTGHLEGESEGHAVLHNPIAKIECESFVTGNVESHNPGEKVSGNITELTFFPCTNNWHVTVVSAGVLSVEWQAGGAGSNGDVYSDKATVEATRFGITCRYATATETVGVATGGTPATMHIDADIDFHSGSPLCGSKPTEWTGSYEVTNPTSLFVDNN